MVANVSSGLAGVHAQALAHMAGPVIGHDSSSQQQAESASARPWIPHAFRTWPEDTMR